MPRVSAQWTAVVSPMASPYPCHQSLEIGTSSSCSCKAIMDHSSILVIGSLNIDLTTRTTRVPEAGETLISKSFDTGSGGKGANQAVACARLSRRDRGDDRTADVTVHMIGAVGDDSFGQDLIKGLQLDGVITEGIKVRKGERTGVACIIVEEATGENRILMSPNANFSLKPADFTNLSTSPMQRDLIVLQLEIPLDTTLQVLKTAKEEGFSVLLNPAPAQVLTKEAYAAVTHLIVNQSEAAIITETTEQNPCWQEWGDHIERIVALGVRHVTITLGAEGVIYLDTQLQLKQRIAAQKVKVVETTAAGDTFVGAYAVAVVRAKSVGFREMMTAIAWANKAAAKTVERRGAQSAIPWLDEIPALPNDGIWGTSFEEWRREHKDGPHSLVKQPQRRTL